MDLNLGQQIAFQDVGGGIAPPIIAVADTWSTVNKNGNTVLSNGNLTAAYQSQASNANTTGKSSGKWQYEVSSLTISNVYGYSFGLIAGLPSNWNEEPGRNTSSVLGTVYWATVGNGRVYEHLGAGDTFTSVADFTQGDNMRLLADLDNLTAKFYKGLTLVKTVTLPAGQTWYIVGYGSNGVITAVSNFGATDFNQTYAGYNAWTQ